MHTHGWLDLPVALTRLLCNSAVCVCVCGTSVLLVRFCAFTNHTFHRITQHCAQGSSPNKSLLCSDHVLPSPPPPQSCLDIPPSRTSVFRHLFLYRLHQLTHVWPVCASCCLSRVASDTAVLWRAALGELAQELVQTVEFLQWVLAACTGFTV